MCGAKAEKLKHKSITKQAPKINLFSSCLFFMLLLFLSTHFYTNSDTGRNWPVCLACMRKEGRAKEEPLQFVLIFYTVLCFFAATLRLEGEKVENIRNR